MAGKSYSAGRIFLQVVPSFKNLQRDIGREVGRANGPLEKQQEEIGKKHEEARERGAQKVRARTHEQQLSAEEQVQQARLKQFQKFSQMYLGEVAKEAKRRQAIEDKNAQLAGKREIEIGLNRAKGYKKADDLIAKMRAKSIADAQAQAKRNAKYLADLQVALANGDIKAAKKAAEERNRIEAEAAKERTRLAAEEAAAEARYEARNEARRKIIRQRRINQRLQDLRAEESARRKLAGGEVGSRIQKGVKGAADAIGVIRITADSSPARQELAALRERLLQLSKQEIGIDMDAGEAMAEIEAIQARLQLLAKNKDAEIDVDVNATAALIALKRIEQQVDQINRKRVAGGVAGWFAGMRSSAEDGANSFRIFNPRVLALITLLPLLAPLLATTAAGIGAIGTAAIGGAAGLGVMILGFTGIFEAVGALGDVQDNAAKDSLAASKTIRNALRSMRDAEQGLSRAREQAARNAESSARRVEDAREGLADTERRVARQIRDALRSQEDAEDALARAQRNATEAQQDLIDARRQAQRDQDDLADRIASGKLDERQALIDLFNAQVAYNTAMADGGSTNLEREEAAIALERARLAIKGIRQENVDLLAQQKKGISGDQNLAAAQERAADALEAQKDAQQRVADTAEAVRDARVEGAEAIADAEQSITDAIRDQREAAADSAIAIRDAQERLNDSQLAYQEALTQTGDIGSSSLQKLEQAMGKLSPAGRDFARFIFGLRDGFYDLRAIVQEGMLPGIQEAMEGVIKRYGPGFARFLGTMSKTIGDFAITFGRALQAPGMERFFATMEKYAPTFFTQFGDLFINLMRIISGIATAFAPFAKEFMDGFVDMSTGWAEWAEGLAGSEGFNKFIDYVTVEGPKVLDLIKDIFLTLLNIGIGLSQTGVFDMIASFFKTLANMDPQILATIVQGILGLMIASQVSAGINSLIISLMLLTGTTVGLVTLGIAALVLGFLWLYDNVEWFRVGWDAAWEWVVNAATAAVDWFKNTLVPWFQDTFVPAMQAVWQWIVDGAVWLWKTIEPTVMLLVDIFKVVFAVIAWTWNNVLFPALEAFANFMGWLWTVVLQPILRIIWEYFVYAFRIIVALINNIVIPVIRFLAGVFMWLWEHAIGPVVGWIATGWSWLWDEILQPILGWIGGLITDTFKGIVWAWDHILAPLFDAIAKLLEGDFVGAWQSAVDAIEGIWNGLKKLIAMPINFIIETVLNEGLFKAFNKVMEFLGLDTRAPRLSRITWGEDEAFTDGQGSKKYGRFFTGGYTGAGGKYEAAGVVHRDEFVVRKEATNKIRQTYGLEALDYINRYGELPAFAQRGYAIGGMVKPLNSAPSGKWGRYPRSGRKHLALDFPVPVGTPIVSPYPATVIRDGWDGSGFGNHVRLDHDGAGEGSYGIFGHLLRDIVKVGQRLAAGQLFGYTGNSGNSTGPHAHIEFRTSPYAPSTSFDFTNAFYGGRAVTPPAGVKGADLPWWADKPLDFLQGAMNAAVNLIPASGIFGDMIKAVPNKIFGGIRGWLADLLGGGEVGEDYITGGQLWNGREVADNGAMMFDNGGYIQPGVTQVLNMTGRPEPVFTADQWDRMGGPGGGALVGTYAPTFNESNLTAGDVMDEFSYTLQRVSHGGKFAGRSH